MATFSIKASGLTELKNRIKAIPQKMKKEIGAELSDSVNRMRMKAIQAAPADQGIIRSGIQVSKISELNYGLFSNAKYSGYLEFGTKTKFRAIPGFEKEAAALKGKGGGTFAEMLDSLTQWVKRKGISGTYSVKTKRRLGSKEKKASEDRQLAYVIALSILKNGIKPQPFFFKQLDVEKPVLIANIKNVLSRL